MRADAGVTAGKMTEAQERELSAAMVHIWDSPHASAATPTLGAVTAAEMKLVISLKLGDIALKHRTEVGRLETSTAQITVRQLHSEALKGPAGTIPLVFSNWTGLVTLPPQHQIELPVTERTHVWANPVDTKDVLKERAAEGKRLKSGLPQHVKDDVQFEGFGSEIRTMAQACSYETEMAMTLDDWIAGIADIFGRVAKPSPQQATGFEVGDDEKQARAGPKATSVEFPAGLLGCCACRVDGRPVQPFEKQENVKVFLLTRQIVSSAHPGTKELFDGTNWGKTFGSASPVW